MIGDKTANVRNGYIDDVVGLDGSGVLKATYAHLVSQELNMQEVTKDTREPLTVVSATAISDTDIVIKFSAPVTIAARAFSTTVHGSLPMIRRTLSSGPVIIGMLRGF